MSGGLPAFIEPVRLAELGRTLEGRLPVARLHRLAEVLADQQGDVEVRLEFGREPRSRTVVRGSIRGVLRLTCQRCLQPFELALDLPVHLVVVRSDAEAGRLAEEEDALLVGDAQALSLAELVEDELLLALPQVPAHPTPGCRPPAGSEIASGAGSSPFAALDALGTPGPTDGTRKGS